jgi:hypothetical protein
MCLAQRTFALPLLYALCIAGGDAGLYNRAQHAVGQYITISREPVPNSHFFCTGTPQLRECQLAFPFFFANTRNSDNSL